MAAIQVKPTRMALSNLKKRKTVAVRGHRELGNPFGGNALR